MRPAARLQAIADLLQAAAHSAQPLDRLVQSWGRRNRYAGSKDRRHISDRLFAIYRHYGALTARLGSDTPLLVAMLAAHILHDEPLEAVLDMADGSRHAPPPLSKADEASLHHAATHPPQARADRLNVPHWLLPHIEAQLGDETDAALSAMGARAPVDVRVNGLKGDREAARAALAADDIEAAPLPHVDTALRLVGTPRLPGTAAFESGLVEVQDAGAQAISAMCAAQPFDTVMDFCAGAGGKALALADAMQNKGRVLVHDVNEERMGDLPARAARAGVQIIEPVSSADLADFDAGCDIVVADVPCSGAGRWRRAPETKWRLTAEQLDGLVALQADILSQAARLVRPGGRLVYMTCSLLACENKDQIEKFIADNQLFSLLTTELPLGQAGVTQWHPERGDSDGFFCAVLQRSG